MDPGPPKSQRQRRNAWKVHRNHAKSRKSTQKLKNDLNERALASLGGSMVYVERDKLFWDGSEIKDQIKKR